MESWKDLTCNQIKAKIEEYRNFDHRNFDSFICAFLSRGEQGCIYAKDVKIELQEIFAKFRGDNCKSLVGKPKIFFIQVLLSILCILLDYS